MNATSTTDRASCSNSRMVSGRSAHAILSATESPGGPDAWSASGRSSFSPRVCIAAYCRNPPGTPGASDEPAWTHQVELQDIDMFGQIDSTSLAIHGGQSCSVTCDFQGGTHCPGYCRSTACFIGRVRCRSGCRA